MKLQSCSIIYIYTFLILALKNANRFLFCERCFEAAIWMDMLCILLRTRIHNREWVLDDCGWTVARLLLHRKGRCLEQCEQWTMWVRCFCQDLLDLSRNWTGESTKVQRLLNHCTSSPCESSTYTVLARCTLIHCVRGGVKSCGNSCFCLKTV